jgi:putative cell wall-binding protein
MSVGKRVEEGDRVRAFLAGLLLAVTALGAIPVSGAAQPAASQDGEIALQFEWKSNKPYAGQFHDVVRYRAADGTATPAAWIRLANTDDPINEDRVSLMLEDPERPVPGFAAQGCYVSCHDDMNDMPGQPASGHPDARHYVLPHGTTDIGDFGLDMWHWRGGRSGPMGYAEDTWVRVHDYRTGAQGRQRDAAPIKPTNWVNSGGDNLHENQPIGGAIAWKGNPLPRFVFDPAKSGFDNYFLAVDGEALTEVEDLTKIANDQYVSQLVVYQDLDFDSHDKVNSIDVRYLLFKAGVIADPGFSGGWHEFWADRLGVETAEQAAALLDDIVDHLEDGVMITRVVGFIYPSKQHDISSTRSFEYDATRGTWTVTLYRALSTEDVHDVDLGAIHDGTAYNFAFSMHDIVIDDGVTHHISVPLKLGSTIGADVVAELVEDTRNVDWSAIGEFSTTVFQPGDASIDFLKDNGSHFGGAAGTRLGLACTDCHSVTELATLSAAHVPSEYRRDTMPVSVRAVYSVASDPTDPVDPLPPVLNVAGDNRFETAIKGSELAYPDGADTVVIATGMNWPDALGGASLAGALDAPILLVGSKTVGKSVLDEIERLGAESIVILGGEAAVSKSVANTLAAVDGIKKVDRIFGSDRYGTAEAIALELIKLLDDKYEGEAFVATAANFPDALAAAPLAAANHWPLFLASPSRGLSANTKAAMEDVKYVAVLGGTKVVSKAVETALQNQLGSDNVDRLSGDNRYETAAVIASYGVDELGMDWNRVGIATGQNFPDALAGGVVQGKFGSVMLLTQRDVLNSATLAALDENKTGITTVTYFGGLNAVSAKVRAAIEAAVK